MKKSHHVPAPCWPVLVLTSIVLQLKRMGRWKW